MKNLCLFVVLFSIASCAFALLSPRVFKERRYRPCDTRETPANVGKFCHRYCAKYKWFHEDTSENCTEWVIDIKDFSKLADFEAFRLGGFILKVETE